MQQQRIPNYEILRVMGHGVFGTVHIRKVGYVFEAWDPTYNRLVAMKRVQKKSNQVSREYEMLIELQGCPNIIQLIV
jgi:serine/threonine protein kinase